jgi:hypothetical protein
MKNKYVYLIRVDTPQETYKSFRTTRKDANALFWDSVASLVRDGWQQFFYIAKNMAGDRVWGARNVAAGVTVYVSQEAYATKDFPAIVGSKSKAARIILDDLPNWTAAWREWAEYWADHSDDDERPLGAQL